MVPGGSQGVLKNNNVQKLFQVEGFFYKKKKSFCTVCLKSVVRGDKLNFGEKSFIWAIGHPQQKVGKSQEDSGMGRLKIF